MAFAPPLAATFGGALLFGAATAVLAYHVTDNTASVTFAGGAVPDGRYRLTIRGADVMAAGTGLSLDGDGVAGGDYTFDFFVLRGDVTRDAAVDFNDLVVLAQHYNHSGGQAWADGDVTGDGNVDFNDLVVLAQNYNTSLDAAPAPAAAASTESFAAAFARARARVAPPTPTPVPATAPPAKPRPVPAKPVVAKPTSRLAGPRSAPAVVPVTASRPANPFAATRIRPRRDATGLLAQ